MNLGAWRVAMEGRGTHRAHSRNPGNIRGSRCNEPISEMARPSSAGSARPTRHCTAGKARRCGHLFLGRVWFSRRHGAWQDVGAARADPGCAPSRAQAIGLSRLRGQLAWGVLVLRLSKRTGCRLVCRVAQEVDAQAQANRFTWCSTAYGAQESQRQRLRAVHGRQAHPALLAGIRARTESRRTGVELRQANRHCPQTLASLARTRRIDAEPR